MAMKMKKVACAVIFAAASVSAVLAAESAVSPVADTPAGAGAAAGTPDAAPAAGPTSAAASTMPVIGSIVGASLLSLVSYFLQ